MDQMTPRRPDDGEDAPDHDILTLAPDAGPSPDGAGGASGAE